MVEQHPRSFFPGFLVFCALLRVSCDFPFVDHYYYPLVDFFKLLLATTVACHRTENGSQTRSANSCLPPAEAAAAAAASFLRRKFVTLALINSRYSINL